MLFDYILLTFTAKYGFPASEDMKRIEVINYICMLYLAWRTNNTFSLLHIDHDLFCLHKWYVVECRVNNHSLDVSLPLPYFFGIFFHFDNFCFSLMIIKRIFSRSENIWKHQVWTKLLFLICLKYIYLLIIVGDHSVQQAVSPS